MFIAIWSELLTGYIRKMKGCFMKNILFLIFFLILKLSATEPNMDWVKYYDDNLSHTNNSLLSLKISDDGLIYSAGTYYDFTDSVQVQIIKFNQITGDTCWARKDPSNTSGNDYPVKILEFNHNIYVSGNLKRHMYGSFKGFFVTKYNESGDVIWTKTFQGIDDNFARLADLKIDSYGNLLLIGMMSNNEFLQDINVIKVNSAGEVLWNRKIDNNKNNDSPLCGLLTNEGNLLVVGKSTEGSSYAQKSQVIIAELSAQGDLLWQKKYLKNFGSYPPTENTPTGVKIDNDGNIYISGTSGWPCAKGSHNEAFLLKRNSFGDSLWINTYRLDGFHYSGKFNDLILGSDNSIYLTGSDNENKFIVFKYGSDGSFLWKKNILNWTTQSKMLKADNNSFYCLVSPNTSEYIQADKAAYVKIDQNGNLIGCATSSNYLNSYGNELISDGANVYIASSEKNSYGNYEAAIFKFNNLNVIKEYKFHQNVYNSKSVIKSAIATDGSVYMVGNSYINNKCGMLIIKTDYSGKTLWQLNYKDYANRIFYPDLVKIDPENNLIISGHSTFSDSDSCGDLFIMKISSLGNFMWTNSSYNNFNDYLEKPSSLIFIGDDIYLASNYKSQNNENQKCYLYRFDQYGSQLKKQSYTYYNAKTTKIHSIEALYDRILLTFTINNEPANNIQAMNVLRKESLNLDFLAGKEFTAGNSLVGMDNNAQVIIMNSNRILGFYCNNGKNQIVEFAGNFDILNTVDLGQDNLTKMIKDVSNNFYLIGSKLVKLDFSLNKVWEKSFDIQLSDIIIKDNSVIVMGTNDQKTSIAKIDCDGNMIWRIDSNTSSDIIDKGMMIFLDSRGKIVLAFDHKVGESISNQFGLMAFDEVDSINEFENKSSTLLISNYPNPFNNSTVVRFNIKADCSAELILINSLGQMVDKWQFNHLNAGEHLLNIDSNKMTSGVYYLQLKSGNEKVSCKILLLK